MKTMKNVLMILLGAALVLSLAGVGAVAADTTYTGGKWMEEDGTETDGDITVTYRIDETYSVTIPPDVDLTNGPITDSFEVQAILSPSSDLIVTVKSANGWNLVYTDNNDKYSIPYTLTIGEETISIPDKKDEIKLYRWAEDGSNVALELVFATPTLPTVAGDYTDTLSFTVTPPAGEA